MKNFTPLKILLIAVINIASSTIQSANAQEPVLWGMTSQGGVGDSLHLPSGNIFSINASGSGFTQKFTFTNEISQGINPRGDLLQASNGMLYGMTVAGGHYGRGILYEYDPATTLYSKKFDFNKLNGELPYGGLIQALNGKLYGMTRKGGTYKMGVLFEYDLATNVYTKLLDFNGLNGEYPQGSLLQASNGKLYGMTYNTLFEYDLLTTTFTKKFDFNATDGFFPYGSLMQATNGKLYGTTSQGGIYYEGTLFEYDIQTNSYVKKNDFDYRRPMGSLVQALNGKIYGLKGGDLKIHPGILFEYDPVTSVTINKKVLYGSAGEHPRGGLMLASNGLLYGMTIGGDGYIKGTLFEYNPSTNFITTKFYFSVYNKDGDNPYGTPIQASNGKLYGVTYRGGGFGSGVIFEYDIVSSVYKRIHNFNINPNGSHPYGSLMQAANGKFYGMTSDGGNNNMGVLFEYNPGTNVYTKKFDFLFIQGVSPSGNLIQYSNGKLYGVTNNGGLYSKGVIFEYDPVANVYITKYIFDSSANGNYPAGSLIHASNGKLYGMTHSGGLHGGGTLFSFNPKTNVYSKKFDFNYPQGGGPNGSLMQASNGKLYGLTTGGGDYGDGVLFEFDPASNVYSRKYNFSNLMGTNPDGNLTEGSNGKLYGMTYQGGSGGYAGLGVLFEFDPATNVYAKKIEFSLPNGSYPQGSLMLSSNGKLYGMTTNGGSNGAGVIFEYDPVLNIYTKKFDFNLSSTGGYPKFSNLIEPAISMSATSIKVTSTTICSNQSATLKVQGGFLGAGANWHWYSDSCGGTAVGIGDSIIVSPKITTIYYVRAEGSNITTCAHQKIKVLGLPVLDVTPVNDTICPGNSINLNASGNSTSYMWKPSTSLSSSTSATVIATPASTTIYKVTGTTANGCTKSKTIKVTVQCPTPTGLNVFGISSHIATAYWNYDSCATSFSLQYNKQGDTTMSTVATNFPLKIITGLTANTNYQCRLAAQCSDGSYSQFTPFQNFTTPSARFEAEIGDIQNNQSFSFAVHPNPTSDVINLEFNNITDAVVRLIIHNVTGQVVMQKEITIADGIYSEPIDTRNFSKGIYSLSISKGDEIQSIRLVKE